MKLEQKRLTEIQKSKEKFLHQSRALDKSERFIRCGRMMVKIVTWNVRGQMIIEKSERCDKSMGIRCLYFGVKQARRQCQEAASEHLEQ